MCSMHLKSCRRGITTKEYGVKITRLLIIHELMNYIDANWSIISAWLWNNNSNQPISQYLALVHNS